MAGLAACMIAFTGCVSVESTKAQLASGDPAQIAKAEENLIKIIGNGDQSTNGSRSYSTDERMKFIEIVQNNDVIMAASEIALNDYNHYSSDREIAIAAMRKLKFNTKEDAAKFIRWAARWEKFSRERSIHYDEVRDVFDKAFTLLDEQATIKVITDPASVVDMRGTSRGERMINMKREREYEYTVKPALKKILSPGVENLADSRSLADRISARERSVMYQVLLHLANVAQTPDLLCKILIGKIAKFDDETRKSVEARLLPKIDQISDVYIKYLLGERNHEYELFKYTKDKHLITKMIEGLDKEEQEKLALSLLDRRWEKFQEYFDFVIVAATATKDDAIKSKVAEVAIKRILYIIKDKEPDQWDLHILDGWTKKDDIIAEKMVEKVIKMAGDKWLASVLVPLELAPEFLTKQITPEVAATALEKGGIKSLKMEEALAELIPAEKITANMCAQAKSGNAKKTLEARMPQSVKAAVSAANTQSAARVLEEAKAKVNETFVLGGFYLGMTIDDAKVLLAHYFPEWTVNETKDDDDDALYVPGQNSPFCYAPNKTRRIYQFNFGKKFLRKWYSYDVQNYTEWAMKYSSENKIPMNPKLISKETTVWEPDMSCSYNVFFRQHSFQYKNNSKEYRITYFGEKEDFTIQGGLGGEIIKALAAPKFRYVGDDPGTLRVRIERD